jgi:acyl-CoA thioester hydrolase
MSRRRLTDTNAPLDTLPASLYIGSANTWECDEMGHLNVRFYVARAWEGVAILGQHLGLRDPFLPGGGATLTPRDIHVRFLKEVRPGQPLRMRGGVVRMGETDAQLYLELRHGDGTPAATFQILVEHGDQQRLKPFPWGQPARRAAEALVCRIPAHGAARSIDQSQAGGEVSLARAEALNVGPIGRSLVTTADVDAFGRMRPEMFIGRVSDAVPNLLADWRNETGAQAAAGDPVGAAVLEYRLLYRRLPRTGDIIEVRSAVAEVAEKTQRLVHWLVDPRSGGAWASAEAVAITFNLATRKAIVPPPAQRAALAAITVKDYRI